jgi:hypothetical protein
VDGVIANGKLDVESGCLTAGDSYFYYGDFLLQMGGVQYLGFHFDFDPVAVRSNEHCSSIEDVLYAVIVVAESIPIHQRRVQSHWFRQRMQDPAHRYFQQR